MGTECCMSGCAHCVYDIYLADVEEYHEQLGDARTALLAKGEISDEEWPRELGQKPRAGAGQEKGEDPKDMAARALQDSYAKLDPSMRCDLLFSLKVQRYHSGSDLLSGNDAERSWRWRRG